MKGILKFYEEFKYEYGEKMLEELRILETCRIVSIDEIEKKDNYYYFVANFNNGEVLQMFTDGEPSIERVNGEIKIGTIDLSIYEKSVVLSIGIKGFGCCCIPLAMFKGE